jgi:hypothetical protein
VPICGVEFRNIAQLVEHHEIEASELGGQGAGSAPAGLVL